MTERSFTQSSSYLTKKTLKEALKVQKVLKTRKSLVLHSSFPIKLNQVKIELPQAPTIILISFQIDGLTLTSGSK
jgi:hypothetical protein